MCQALGGCSMTFSVEDAPGLPINYLVGKQHVMIRFLCNGCRFSRESLPEAVIKKLYAIKAPAGDRTPVDGLAKFAKEPCPMCKKTNWRVFVVWPRRDTMGFRAAHPEG